MKVKQEKNVIWLLLKISVTLTISIENFLRALFIDIVVRFIFKNKKKSTLTPVLHRALGITVKTKHPFKEMLYLFWV